MGRTPTSQTNRTCNNLSLCDRRPPVPLHSPPVPRSETTARPSPVNAPLQPSHPTRPTPLACGPKPSFRTPHFNPPPARSARTRPIADSLHNHIIPPARSARTRPQTPPERPHKRASARKTTLSGRFRLGGNSSRPLESLLRASQDPYGAFPPPARGRQTTRSSKLPNSPPPKIPKRTTRDHPAEAYNSPRIHSMPLHAAPPSKTSHTPEVTPVKTNVLFSPAYATLSVTLDPGESPSTPSPAARAAATSPSPPIPPATSSGTPWNPATPY